MRDRVFVRILLGILCCFIATAASARVIYVNAGASGANDGSSWANAFNDLQSAMVVDVAGDEIWVATGTYKPTSGSDRAASFVMQAGVAMYGGFAGGETDRAQRNPAANATILSGDIGTSSPLDNAYCVVLGANQATLDGFTITLGYNNSATMRVAGGMTNDLVSPAVSRCVFIRNAGDAGAMMCNSSSAVVSDCAFTSNTAIYSGSVGGGAMQCNASSMTLTACAFTGNHSDFQGGAISIYGANAPSIVDCTFTNNSADSVGVIPDTLKSGGAIYSETALPLVSGCRFTGNSAEAGGAIHHHSAGEIRNCIFSGNRGGIVAGAIWNHNAACAPKFSNCVFERNTATNGAAIHNYQAQMTATNCVFYANHADNVAGAIYCYLMPTGPFALTNCTFTTNTATRGGAVYISTPQVPSSLITYTNCIMWGNYAPVDPQLYNVSAAPVIGNCDIDGAFINSQWNAYFGTDAGGNISAAPKFSDIRRPEGPDGIWKTDDDGLRLMVGSPCIDAGRTTALTQDILGADYLRQPDIGAYETIVSATRNWGVYR